MKSNKKPSQPPTPPIYHVYFEDYLKPKSFKKQNSLLFVDQVSQKSQLRLKLLEHPVLIAGYKSKWTLLNEKLAKRCKSKLKNPLKPQQNPKIPSIYTIGGIKLPRFLTFLYARNDVTTCKRKSGFEIYCEIASIHGFNNFVGAATWQRALWFLVILIAVIMSGFILLLSHLNNLNTPTLLYTETTQYPTWSIPFPAVTICNLNRISKSKANNLAKTFQQTTNMTLEELIAHFKFALFTTDNIMANSEDYKRLDTILKINNHTMLQLLENIAPNCDKQLLKCSLHGKFIACGNLFKKTQTPFGQCCSFNYKALEKIFTKRTDYQANKHVVYISNCGYIAGLSVLLDPRVDDYKASSTLTPGFRVLIHDAHDYPDITSMQRIIIPATSNKVSISPYQTYATDHISSLGIQSRRCYLPNEQKMYHFGSYSQANCLAECHSSMMYKKCNCALPYRPKKHNWTVCALEDMQCYFKYKSLLKSDLKSRYSLFNPNQQFICDCYPLCDFNKYNIAMDSGELKRKYSMTEKRLYQGVNITNHILLRVFISDLYAERSRLDVYENWLSFLGTFGGITGLFMGYSFLSGFELIFFVFVRPACNWLTRKQIEYRIKKRRKKAQREEAARQKSQQQQ